MYKIAQWIDIIKTNRKNESIKLHSNPIQLITYLVQMSPLPLLEYYELSKIKKIKNYLR